MQYCDAMAMPLPSLLRDVERLDVGLLGAVEVAERLKVAPTLASAWPYPHWKPAFLASSADSRNSGTASWGLPSLTSASPW